MYLVVGGDSLIGSEIVKTLTKKKKSFFFTSRKKNKKKHNQIFLDLINPIKLNIKPKTIILCTGNSKLTISKKKYQIFNKINTINTLKFLKQFKKNTRIIFLSSESVFGYSDYGREINSKKNPISFYGKQKSNMENRLKNLGYNYTIFRLSKVVSKRIAFFNEMIKKIKKGKPFRMYSNYYFSPISLKYLIKNILNVSKNGTFHLSNRDSLSYSDFSKIILKKMCKDNINIIKDKKISKPNFPSPKLKMLLTSNQLKIKPQKIDETIRDFLHEK